MLSPLNFIPNYAANDGTWVLMFKTNESMFFDTSSSSE